MQHKAAVDYNKSELMLMRRAIVQPPQESLYNVQRVLNGVPKFDASLNLRRRNLDC